MNDLPQPCPPWAPCGCLTWQCLGPSQLEGRTPCVNNPSSATHTSALGAGARARALAGRQARRMSQSKPSGYPPQSRGAHVPAARSGREPALAGRQLHLAPVGAALRVPGAPYCLLLQRPVQRVPAGTPRAAAAAVPVATQPKHLSPPSAAVLTAVSACLAMGTQLCTALCGCCSKDGSALARHAAAPRPVAQRLPSPHCAGAKRLSWLPGLRTGGRTTLRCWLLVKC